MRFLRSKMFRARKSLKKAEPLDATCSNLSIQEFTFSRGLVYNWGLETEALQSSAFENTSVPRVWVRKLRTTQKAKVIPSLHEKGHFAHFVFSVASSWKTNAFVEWVSLTGKGFWAWSWKTSSNCSKQKVSEARCPSQQAAPWLDPLPPTHRPSPSPKSRGKTKPAGEGSSLVWGGLSPSPFLWHHPLWKKWMRLLQSFFFFQSTNIY